MPFLTKEDLRTHLYGEVIDEIVRAQEDATQANKLIDQAISSAVSKAKSYMGKYNLVKLFGSGTTAPLIVDDYLKDLVKDLAVWNLLKLANPDVNLEFFRTIYEDAIKTFTDIQKGMADPDGWPYKDNDPDTRFNESGFINYSSNRKRNQHF